MTKQQTMDKDLTVSLLLMHKGKIEPKECLIQIKHIILEEVEEKLEKEKQEKLDYLSKHHENMQMRDGWIYALDRAIAIVRGEK